MTEQEVCIGSLGQQKVYLHWSDVKDICTNAVSEAYEQARKENTKLKDLLKECKLAIFDYPPYDLASDKIRLQIKINQVLGEE